MNRIIYALFGLTAAASLEANPGGMQTFSVADSLQSFCGIRCAVVNKSIEKQSTIAFSLPKIENSYQCHYSLFENKLECAKLRSGSEIFFPSDGHQPTATEAVQWSCANLEDELVTDWYMSIFGLSETNPQLMGFNSKNEKCRIINFDPELDATKSAEALALKATFIANFRKIASVSVGRVLLYRLLLEIRRTDAAGNGCIDEKLEKSLLSKDLRARNELRNIVIKNSDKNTFNSNGYIRFYDSKDQKQTNVVDEEPGKSIVIIRESRTDDIGLFHEMLHWFHALRDINRHGIEKNINSETNNKNIFNSNMHMEDEKVDLWYGKKSKCDDELVIKMEEFRTIMGYTVKVIKGSEVIYETKAPVNGDDLCENLYRICVGQKLRYGHVSAEDPRIIVSKSAIDRAKEFYEKSIKEGNYRVNKH